MSTIVDIGKIWYKNSSRELHKRVFINYVFSMSHYHLMNNSLFHRTVQNVSSRNTKKSFCESIGASKVEENQEAIFENRKCH